MAADQERADRIRLLKQENPQFKWRHIADHVGVELRSAQMWQETGAISYENAKKLAELVGCDVDWIMRGEARSPDPFPQPVELDGVQSNFLEFIAQQAAAQTRVLVEIRDLLQDERTALGAATERVSAAADDFQAIAAQTVRAFQAGAPPRSSEGAETAPRRTR